MSKVAPVVGDEVWCPDGNHKTGECRTSFCSGVTCKHARRHERTDACGPIMDCPGCVSVGAGSDEDGEDEAEG